MLNATVRYWKYEVEPDLELALRSQSIQPMGLR